MWTYSVQCAFDVCASPSRIKKQADKLCTAQTLDQRSANVIDVGTALIWRLAEIFFLSGSRVCFMSWQMLTAKCARADIT